MAARAVSRSSAALAAMLALALGLPGCAGRGAITVDPAAADVGSVQPMLVASSRAPDPDRPGYLRRPGGGLSFSEIDVSVPPVRQPGTVTFPRPGRPDPETDFLTVGSRPLADRAAFVRAVNAAVAAKPAAQREAFVFVHGFNTNFAEGLYRQAQMRHDFGAPGISVHYAWPSAANVRAYATDRETTLQARDDLEQLIDLLAQTNVKRIVVAGHSMGAFLLMEAMRQKAIRDRPAAFRKLQTIVLMAPDIDVGVFRRQAAPLAADNVSIYVFTSSRDRALRASAALRGSPNRLGNLADPSEVKGLPVTILDLSDIDGNEDALNHFKVATSPVMIALIRGLDSYGNETFQNAERPAGLIGSSVAILQDVTAGALDPRPIR